MAHPIICTSGPFPGSIESAVDAYFREKGAEASQPARDISDNFCYRTTVVFYWHPDFGVTVTYEPNVRGEINSVKFEMVGNGRFPEEMEKDLAALLAPAHTPPAAYPPAGP